MAQGLERIPLVVGSDFKLEPVDWALPDNTAKVDEWETIARRPVAPPESPTAAQPASRTFGDVAGDAGAQLAKGVNMIAGAVPNLIAPESGVAKFFSDNAQYWDDSQSDYTKSVMQAAEAKINEAAKTGVWDEFSTAAKEYMTSPALFQKFVLENAASLVPGLAAAKGAQVAAKGAQLAKGATAAEAAAAGVRAGTVAGSATNSVLNAGGARQDSFEDWKQTLMAQGVSEDEATQIAIEKSRLAAAVGAATGAVSGATGIERNVLGSLSRGGARGFVGGAAKELAGEQLEELAPKAATNAQIQSVDPTRPITHELGRTVAQTLVASSPGAVVSGGAEAMGSSAPVGTGSDAPAEPTADGALVPTAPVDSGPGGGSVATAPRLEAPQALEGEVLGPESLAGGQGLLPSPPIEGELVREPVPLPRPALPAPEEGGPSERQIATARGLLAHSPKASPDLLVRLMRVDQTMANMLFGQWQAQQQTGDTNGNIAGQQADAEMAAPGAEGRSSVVSGSGDVLAFTPDVDGGAGVDRAGLAASGVRPDVAAGVEGDERVTAPTAIDVQAHGAATSPFNAVPQPTDAQKAAGNYRKGHVTVQGLPIAIENPAGSIRSGKDASGKPWQIEMQNHYGYIKGSVGRDKDHLDVFLGPQAEDADTAYVIDQVDPKTGRFDEHKIILGATSEQDARAIYQSNYQAGWNGLGAMTAMPMEDFKAWIKSGETKKPLGLAPDAAGARETDGAEQTNEQPAAPAASRKADPGRIEDFGEKIGGARKDRAAAAAEALKREFSDDEIATLPLSKIWPATDIDAIEDPFVAAVAHTARAAVPAKPRVAYKVARWVSKVKVVRGLAQLILSGDVTKERFRELLLQSSSLKGFAAKVALLEAIDRRHWKRIDEVDEFPDSYRYDDGKKTPSPMVTVQIDGKANVFRGSSSVANVVEKVNVLLGDEPQDAKMQFEVRGYEGRMSINKKGDKEYRKLKTFATSKEAFDFIKSSHGELVAAWEAVKESDNVRKADVRNDENRPRTGKDHRSGKDVTPQQFSDTFGFRGVEFGNWVSQGKNDKERQGMLNQAFDAMMDLADLLGIPPKAISLNGSLGLGFGSRGHGWASAHFEPGNLAINLTKTRGAGTFAHEWFHALDNYFQRKRGETGFAREKSYITYSPETYYEHANGSRIPADKFEAAARGEKVGIFIRNADEWHKVEGVRPEVGEAFADLVKALNESPMAKRAARIDKGPDGYWSRIIERGARSFENYVISKMMQNGYHNDYLANVREVESFPRAKERYPYLLPEEVAPIAEAFDNLFQTMRTSETERGIALESRRAGSIDDLYAAMQPRFGVAEDYQGVPGSLDGKIAFRSPTVVIAHPSPSINIHGFHADGDRFAKFGIFDGQTGTKVGMVELEMAGDKPVALHDIYIDESLQGSGYGAQTVGALLSLNPGDSLKVVEIIKQSERFWESVGAQKGYDGNADLNWHQFAEARPDARGRQEGRESVRREQAEEGIRGDETREGFGRVVHPAEEVAGAQSAAVEKSPADAGLSVSGDGQVPLKLAGDELGGPKPIAEMVREAIRIAREKFAGKVVRNESDGAAIIIGAQGIKHAMSGRVSEVSALAMAKLNEVVQRAKFVKSEPDKAGRNTIREVRFYELPVELDGNASTLRVVVRVAADGTRYYDHFEVEKQTPAGQSGKPLAEDSAQPFAGVAPDRSGTRNIAHPEGDGKEAKSSLTDKTPPPSGVSASGVGAALRGVVDRFKAQFKGAEALDIRVVDHADQIPVRFRPSPYAEGVFHDDAGLIYLVGSNLSRRGKPDTLRAFQVLMHEAVGHYGLSTMMGQRFRGLLKHVMKVARNAKVTDDIYGPGDAEYATVEAVRLRYPDASDVEVAQEVMARMAESGAAGAGFGYVRAVVRQWLRDMARALGFDLSVTTSELNDLIAKASGYMRAGRNLHSEAEPSGLVAASRAAGGLESRAHVAGDSGRQYSAAQQQTFRNIGREVVTPTVKERVAGLFDNIGKKLQQGIADQFAPLKELGGDAYLLSRMSKGADGALEAMLMHGRVFLNGGIYDVDVKDGGMIDKLLRPLGKEIDDFMWWIAGNRAEQLATQGREHLMTPDDIANLKALGTGQLDFDYTLQNGKTTRDRATAYADANRILTAFNKSVLDIAEQSGLIDGAERAIWESDFYVPFYREAEEGDKPKFPNVKKGLVRQKAFERLKGGTDKLNHDLLANTLMNMSHLLNAAAKNRAAKASLQAAESAGVAARAGSDEKGTVYFRDGGKEIHYTVADPFVLDAITALEFSGFSGPAMQAMGAFKRWLTIGVTASPTFKIRNLIRDSVSALGQTELSYNLAQNIAEGYKATNRKSQTYASMLAGGGVIRFGSMIEGNRADHVRRLVEKGVDPDTILDSESKLKAVWRRRVMPLLDAYNEIGDRSENINRAALYEQLLKKGMSHAEASLAARDLLDFSMGGTFTAVRFLTQTVPFANARIQGLYKLGRAAKENPKRMGYVVGTVALASLALLAAYHDDDDWKKREDWDRDTYWWFKVGGVAFRIPKPFEIGAIGTLAERSAELLFDKEMDGHRFGERLTKMVGDTFAMNPVPQMFKPLIDLYSNKDSFTGRPIETAGMEKMRTEDRFSARTSEIAKVVGKAGLLSPVQVDHLVRGYFGWLGTAAVTTTDEILRAGSSTPRPSMKLRDVFLVGSFVETLPSNSSRYVTQMYEQSKEIEEAYASWRNYLKLGDKEQADKVFAAEKDKIGRYRIMQNVKAAEARLNGQIRRVESDPKMSGEAKRAELDRLSQEKDKVARLVAGGAGLK